MVAGNLAKLQVPRERFDSVLICADKDVMNKLNGWLESVKVELFDDANREAATAAIAYLSEDNSVKR